MSRPEYLPARDALLIADSLGFSLRTDRRDIRENLLLARENHLAPRRDGKKVGAREYFENYLLDIKAEREADDAALADFHERAYGRD